MSEKGTTEVMFIYLFARAALKILHPKPLDNEISSKMVLNEIMKSSYKSSNENLIFKLEV